MLFRDTLPHFLEFPLPPWGKYPKNDLTDVLGSQITGPIQHVEGTEPWRFLSASAGYVYPPVDTLAIYSATDPSNLTPWGITGDTSINSSGGIEIINTGGRGSTPIGTMSLNHRTSNLTDGNSGPLGSFINANIFMVTGNPVGTAATSYEIHAGLSFDDLNFRGTGQNTEAVIMMGHPFVLDPSQSWSIESGAVTKPTEDLLEKYNTDLKASIAADGLSHTISGTMDYFMASFKFPSQQPPPDEYIGSFTMTGSATFSINDDDLVAIRLLTKEDAEDIRDNGIGTRRLDFFAGSPTFAEALASPTPFQYYGVLKESRSPFSSCSFNWNITHDIEEQGKYNHDDIHGDPVEGYAPPQNNYSFSKQTLTDGTSSADLSILNRLFTAPDNAVNLVGYKTS